MTTQQKRRVSLLIPCRHRDDGAWEVYLQKRSKDAPRLPDYFGLFGGGIENDETPEQALEREMQEELAFTPQGYKLFKISEPPRDIKYIFILEVRDNFEELIVVQEGEYGMFFTEAMMQQEVKFIEHDLVDLGELFAMLNTFEHL